MPNSFFRWSICLDRLAHQEKEKPWYGWIFYDNVVYYKYDDLARLNFVQILLKQKAFRQRPEGLLFFNSD
ncbi:MAG: hypothetical protein VB050_04975 [Geobacteraceae bacterium]|nr:hypothetical protein [Geobacteraceae bacterium]